MEVLGEKYCTRDSHNYMRDLTEYARARGFECKTGFGADFAGKKMRIEADKQLFEKYLKDSGKTTKDFMQLRGRHFCWSKDDLLRAFARNQALAARRNGVNMLSFHFPDTGDENWGQRCDDCRERFGSDRVKGDANVINLFREEMRRVIPDAKFIAIVHPYHSSYLADPEYIEHFTRLSELIPEDVWICTRETDRAGIVKWNNATRQPTYIYMQPFSLPFRGMIAPVCRTAKTLYFPERSLDICAVKGWAGEFWHIDMPLGAAYAWNTDTPGSEIVSDWSNGAFKAWEFHPRGKYDEELLRQTVPRVAAFTWGEAAGEVAAEIYQSGLRPWLLYDPFRTEGALTRIRGGNETLAGRFPPLTAEDFVFQEKAAEKVCALCLKIMREQVPVARAILVPAATQLYKRAAMARLIAPVWQHYYRAEQAVKDGRLELAKEEIGLARKVAESFDDKIAQIRQFVRPFPQISGSAIGRTMAAVGKLIEKKLTQFEVPSPEQYRKSLLSPKLFKEVTDRVLFAVPVKTPPRIDGTLSESCWTEHPDPVENFVRYPFVGDPRLAADQTVVKVCYDKNNLYVAFHLLDANADSLKSKSRPRDDSGLMADDIVEVIVAPVEGDRSFAQFVVNPAGSKYDVYKRLEGRRGRVLVKEWNPAWEAKTSLWRDGWFAEISIPFAMFIEEPVGLLDAPPKQGDRWRIDLAREKRTLELSAIKYMPDSGFRAVEKFSVLHFR